MAEQIANWFERITERGKKTRKLVTGDRKQDALKNMEVDLATHALVLQATPDSSQGADVVRIENNTLIVVDGVGNGVTGKRAEAEQLTQQLFETDSPLATNGAYIALSAKNGFLSLRARAGCFGVAWNINPQSGLLEPQVIYAGSDTHPNEVHHTFNIDQIKFVMALTDGGVDFLASPDLFGDRKEFSSSAAKIVGKIGFDQILPDDIPGAFTRVLLRPLTAILNENDVGSAYTALQKRFRGYNEELQLYKTSPFTDDATLVISSIEYGLTRKTQP